MDDLDRRGRAIDHDNLMAPIELIGFSGIEAERHIGTGRRFPCRLRPARRGPAHHIIAAAITTTAQLFVNPYQRQTFAFGTPCILSQHIIQLGPPRIVLGARLSGAVMAELRRSGAHDLAHRVP